MFFPCFPYIFPGIFAFKAAPSNLRLAVSAWGHRAPRFGPGWTEDHCARGEDWGMVIDSIDIHLFIDDLFIGI